jgi:hypothetical protein
MESYLLVFDDLCWDSLGAPFRGPTRNFAGQGWQWFHPIKRNLKFSSGIHSTTTASTDRTASIAAICLHFINRQATLSGRPWAVENHL